MHFLAAFRKLFGRRTWSELVEAGDREIADGLRKLLELDGSAKYQFVAAIQASDVEFARFLDAYNCGDVGALKTHSWPDGAADGFAVYAVQSKSAMWFVMVLEPSNPFADMQLARKRQADEALEAEIRAFDSGVWFSIE